MEGGYGTMSADREKVVSTLVIEDVPFNVSGPGRFDACARKRKQSVTHSPSRSLDLNYQMRKMRGCGWHYWAAKKSHAQHLPNGHEIGRAAYDHQGHWT
jgi:hypothetical protein